MGDFNLNITAQTVVHPFTNTTVSLTNRQVYEQLRYLIFPRTEWSDADDNAEDINSVYNPVPTTCIEKKNAKGFYEEYNQRLDYIFYSSNFKRLKYSLFPQLSDLIRHQVGSRGTYFSDHRTLMVDLGWR